MSKRAKLSQASDMSLRPKIIKRKCIPPTYSAFVKGWSSSCGNGNIRIKAPAPSRIISKRCSSASSSAGSSRSSLHDSGFESSFAEELTPKELFGDENNASQDETDFREIKKSERVEYFELLPDEMVLKVLAWLPKVALGRLAQTSRRLECLVKDVPLWKEIDAMGKLLPPSIAGVILEKKPVYLRMAKATIQEPSGLINGQQAPQLTYLDLSYITIDSKSLECLLGMCTTLRKLSLEQVKMDQKTVAAMETFSKTINTLNLCMCTGIPAADLAAFFSKCNRIIALNVGCIVQNWTSEELMAVVKAIPKCTEFLNLSGFKLSMKDGHIAIIASRCINLIDLDLSDCQKITGLTLVMLSSLKELQHLALNRCFDIDASAYQLLGEPTSVLYLDVFHYKEQGLAAVAEMLPNMKLNNFQYSTVARPTVGNARSSIWLRRVRDY